MDTGEIGFGRIHVSPELLVQALHMPADTKILQVFMKDNKIIIMVSAPGLPDCKFGAEPILLMPVIHHTVESYEWDWNIGVKKP